MKSIWKRVRVDEEHLIRPELIIIARKRIFEEAIRQLILCRRGECCGASGRCDDSCTEAKAFLQSLSEGDYDEEAFGD